MCPFNHALVLAKTTGDKDVALEYLASDRRRGNSDTLRLSRGIRLANLFLRAGGDCFGLRRVSLVYATHHESQEREAKENFNAFVIEHVFRNKYIWIVSIANFFVYIIRYAVLDWGPTMLTQAKHIKIAHAAWLVAGFEFGGLLGALFGGWITDRFLRGRAVRVCFVYMLLAGVSIFVFWEISVQSEILMAGILAAAGFFIYGPQCLLAVTAANLATKRAAATAIGLTSIFGYASTVLSGWGLGALVQYYGWNVAFKGLIIVAALGSLLFAMAWKAKAHGYENEESEARA